MYVDSPIDNEDHVEVEDKRMIVDLWMSLGRLRWGWIRGIGRMVSFSLGAG